MKNNLLDALECPECRGGLRVVDRDGPLEIINGLLKCDSCSRHYPVIGGIPRLLPDKFMPTVKTHHQEFFEKFKEYNIDRSARDDSWEAKATRRTSRSFGYQWNVFSTMYKDWKENFLDYVQPLDEKFFAGKRGLDMGCGFGRHLYWSSTFGAEMVGVDLSEAVEAAYQNTKHFPNVNVVQGDIYNLPFKKEYFDFGYSIGVLHHLPDPRAGFGRLAKMVRPGGTVFAWVYGVRRGPVEWLSVFLRKLAARMSLRTLHLLCVLIAVFLRVFSHYPYRILSGMGMFKGLAEKLPLKDHARYPFSVTIADAFDRLSVPICYYYNGDEFRTWFTGEGLQDIQIIRRFKNNESWRGVGVKPASPAK